MNIVKIIAGISLAMLVVVSAAYAREIRAETHPQTESTDDKQAYGQLLLEAEALVKNGKPADAYALLEPHEFEHSGEERFDYLIGIAALDSGRADKATLAFERVLMVNPDSAAARLDMARAYYQLGDLPRAKTEFTTSLQQNPSEAARANIEKYLDEIVVREAGKQTSYSGYVAVTAGQDNNVNNSTSQSQVFVDAMAAKITLDPSNVKISDSYYGLVTGGEITHNLNNRWGLYAGADIRQRANSMQKNFDAFSVDARLGAMLVTQAHRVRIGVSDGQYSLGNSRNSDSIGLNAEWSRVFSPSNQLKVFGQYAQYRFVDAAMQVNDYDQQAVGGGWGHALADGKSTLFGSLYYGTEKDVSTQITTATPNGGRADGAKRFSGLRIGGQTAFNDRITLYANAGGQIGDYSKINYFFQRQRSDRMYDLAIGANWRWDKLWTLRPQLNYSGNNSNIIIYSYDRTDFSLTIRRDFR
ncbi:MAG: tetratricopeptide repeat protein [Nitrosomonadales bacterium]|nr:tetratricopeptide repeat protein [Nitrosomonadales bacterium]